MGGQARRSGAGPGERAARQPGSGDLAGQRGARGSAQAGEAMNPVERLPDDEARRRIATDLDSSLVVVAGAGTGKTSALVERIVELVGSGAPVRDLAAITFTEAAASELRS